MHLTKKTIAALFAVIALGTAGSANASLMRETFMIEVLDGFPAAGETGTVEIEWDADLVEQFEDPFTGEADLFGNEFSMTADVFGQTFTNANDVGFDTFPILSFIDGSITFLDFVTNEFDFFNPTDIVDPRIEEWGGGDIIGDTWFITTFGPEPEEEVPAPATLALLLAGLWRVGRARRKALAA